MTPRTPTLPPTEPAMWRKLLARAHPDTGGDHVLFVWAASVRDVVCGAGAPRSYETSRPSRQRENPTAPRSYEGRPSEEAERIPFSASGDVEGFEGLTRRAVGMASEQGGVYEFVLRLLEGCRPAQDGPLRAQQRVGATYKQLAAIGHTVGMIREERIQWYCIAEAVPLSQRHAHHILRKLARKAA